MGRLEGRSTVVTGVASGIGRATSLLFAKEGAAVVCVDRAGEVEATAAAIREAGGRAVAVIGDAGVGSAVGGCGPLDQSTPEGWMEVLRINRGGPFLAVKHASAVMKQKGKGSIICTASVAGIRSGAGGVPYSASKAGVINLVQTSANLLYGTGVRVNAICPGLIETGMTRGLYVRARDRGTEDRIGQLNPLKRGGEPHEIAGAALFLASDDSSYVNGHALVVDGGLSSSHPVGQRRGA